MKNIRIISISVIMLLSIFLIIAAAQGGFDEFGYNYKARIFVGPADGYDRVFGNDPIYGNDHLVMKWNAEWDRGNNEGWLFPPYNAWTNNEWNGNVTNGSGEMWVYKIVWVGPTGLADYEELPSGGYSIWGQFAVILSQGTIDGEHIWDTQATPAGYGVYYE